MTSLHGEYLAQVLLYLRTKAQASIADVANATGISEQAVGRNEKVGSMSAEWAAKVAAFYDYPRILAVAYQRSYPSRSPITRNGQPVSHVPPKEIHRDIRRYGGEHAAYLHLIAVAPSSVAELGAYLAVVRRANQYTMKDAATKTGLSSTQIAAHEHRGLIDATSAGTYRDVYPTGGHEFYTAWRALMGSDHTLRYQYAAASPYAKDRAVHKRIGEALRTAREAAGMQRRSLGHLVGVEESTVRSDEQAVDTMIPYTRAAAYGNHLPGFLPRYEAEYQVRPIAKPYVPA